MKCDRSHHILRRSRPSPCGTWDLVVVRIFSVVSQAKKTRKTPFGSWERARVSFLLMSWISRSCRHASMHWPKEIKEGHHKQLDLAFSLFQSDANKPSLCFSAGFSYVLTWQMFVFFGSFFQCSLVRAPEHCPNWDVFFCLCHCAIGGCVSSTVSIALDVAAEPLSLSLRLYPAHAPHIV